MLEWFMCPDKELISVKECFTKCRMDERCQTVPYLHRAAEEREWTGEASTTQLLNGTMYTFLKLTQPYAIDPDSMAFAILGSKVHEYLESKANELGIPAELALTPDGRNIVDLIEYENGKMALTDYKTWGSYKVAKVLGIVETGKQPDPSGAVYKSSGKWGKAGSPKMVSTFQQMPQQADNWEAELQLNRYRVMLEEKGIHPDKLKVHVTVRDGGLAIAHSRGLDRNTYMIAVKVLPDDTVTEYFDTKQHDLALALSNGSWSIPCTDRECWDGIRCKDYCEISIFCPKGLLHQEG